ncbi:NAD(P)/FAD-dependent oxidoreductase [Gallalistipes aquisgranensis]|uniref:NAD(P)/FAD-dependent oxidoreductase n=1 Tax=Gallalistipes aquisgranensis TaxID=2779358 RepID=UPI001CF928BF|nr:NAD(P)/FAD-dependent oxidoreductase [Gallalistipes aquisgranensis]MBE5033347.1 NAD(P)/FAD-dependent oxidoreductase [Gallalistipes aquisgranensis]
MSLNIPHTGQRRVVVVGGGFAGLKLVRRLARLDCQVVLIDRNNYHQFQPLLYQVATSGLSPEDISFPFRKLFRGKRNVHFRMAELEAVEPDRRRIETSSGSLTYDYLVLATGSVTNFFGMESIREAAMPMKNLRDALVIRNRLLENLERATVTRSRVERQGLLNVVIVGGGPSGVELAGAVTEMKRYIMPEDYPDLDVDDINIYLVEGGPRLLASMSEKSSAEACMQLRRMGVRVMLGTSVVDYGEGRVRFRDGSFILTGNLVWTSGVTVEPIEGIDPMTVSRSGRIGVDDYSRVVGYHDIFVVGDAAMQRDTDHPDGFPQLARVAIEQADHLSRNLAALLRRRPMKPFVYREYPVMATVGRNRAFAEFGRRRVGGFVAWVAWALLHVAFVLGVKNKFNILVGWAWNYVTYDHPVRLILAVGDPCRQALGKSVRLWE